MAEVEETRRRKEEEAAQRRELAKQQKLGAVVTADAMEDDDEFEQFDVEDNELLDDASEDEESMQVVGVPISLDVTETLNMNRTTQTQWLLS